MRDFATLPGLLIGLLVLGCACQHRIGLTGRDGSIDGPVDDGMDVDSPDVAGDDPSADWGADRDVITDPIPDATMECTPPEGTWAYFTIDGTDWPREEHLDYTIRCYTELIEAWSSSLLFYHLDCWSDTGEYGYHRVEMSTDPGFEDVGGLPGVPEHEDVLLRYVVEGGEPPSRWFTISTMSGEMLMAGIDAGTMTPPGHSGILWPIEIVIVDSLCPIEFEECYDPERVALDVIWNTHGARVHDGQLRTIGTLEDYYNVFLENGTKHHHPLECGIGSASWYTALIYRMPFP